MALTERDIEALMKGITPALREQRDRITALERRLEVTEAKSADPLTYFGVWQPGAYAKNAATTWGGSLWIAQRATTAKPGESGLDSRAWVLAVKRGADGKDGRP